MNRVCLVGRMTRDPELRYTGDNTPVVSFTLAVNRTFTNKNGEREADFISVVLWRKQAEAVNKYTSKGSLISVEGRIQSRTYEDKNGDTKYVTEVVADNVQFLDSKSDSSQEIHREEKTKEAMAKKEDSTSPDPFQEFGDNIEISDDDLPF